MANTGCQTTRSSAEEHVNVNSQNLPDGAVRLRMRVRTGPLALTRSAQPVFNILAVVIRAASLSASPGVAGTMLGGKDIRVSLSTAPLSPPSTIAATRSSDGLRDSRPIAFSARSARIVNRARTFSSHVSLATRLRT
jgi:hypothetical protein